jgi:hypothetical protein
MSEHLTEKIAEVIDSNTAHFTATNREDVDEPAFGSIVAVQTRGITIYGVIHFISKQSIDANRRAMQLNLSPDELRKEYPQLAELVRTEFKAVVIGYKDAGGKIRQTTPPYPPNLHDFVYRCPDIDRKVFAQGKLSYLRTILTNTESVADDLLIAVLRGAYAVRGQDVAVLIDAGRELTFLLGDDHKRLESIMERVQE